MSNIFKKYSRFSSKRKTASLFRANKPILFVVFPYNGRQCQRRFISPHTNGFLNILTEQGKIHHGNLEDHFNHSGRSFYKKFCRHHYRRSQSNRYLRMRLAQYHALFFQENKRSKHYYTRILEWAQTHIPSLGKILVDIQNALALIEPISRNQTRRKTVMELLGALSIAMDFMKRRATWFSGRYSRSSRKNDFSFFQHWNTLEIRDFSQKKWQYFCITLLKSIPMKRMVTFPLFLQYTSPTTIFFRGCFWFARLQLLQKYFRIRKYNRDYFSQHLLSCGR